MLKVTIEEHNMKNLGLECEHIGMMIYKGQKEGDYWKVEGEEEPEREILNIDKEEELTN